jgi:hypothetical protein
MVYGLGLTTMALPPPRRTGSRHEVFFDPATSATLGTREVNPRLQRCELTRLRLGSYSVYLEQATVDSIHTRP